MAENQDEAERETLEGSSSEQPTAEHREVISVKELAIKRVTVDLPNGGRLKLFPYLSAGAMSAALSTEDERRILKRLLDKSIHNESTVTSANLSKSDWDYIARYFLRIATDSEAEFAEVVARYDGDFNQHGDRHRAFAVAFKSTQQWQASQESRRRQIESVQRMVDEHQRVASAMMRQFNQQTFQSPAMEVLNLTNRFSIQLPTIHQEFQVSIDRVSAQVAKILSFSPPRIELALPKLTVPNPMTEAMKQVQTQLGTIKLIQDEHLVAFRRVKAILDSFKLPDVSSLVDFSALNNAVSGSFALTLKANRLFSSVDYLSPRRIREEVLRPHDPTDWVEELEGSEGAIVAEAVTTQQAIGSIIGRHVQAYLQDVLPQTHPDLHQYIESMTKPEEFINVLRRFAFRVAREDFQLFWSDYGIRFNAKPEAIGKALFGSFLEGYCRGTAFVAHELHAGEGYVDVLVFFMNKTFIIELKVVGPNWSFGKAESGLSQLQYYDDLHPDAELFMVVFDGRKTERGKRLPKECKLENGKTARVLHVPIFSIAPTKSC